MHPSGKSNPHFQSHAAMIHYIKAYLKEKGWGEGSERGGLQGGEGERKMYEE